MCHGKEILVLVLTLSFNKSNILIEININQLDKYQTEYPKVSGSIQSFSIKYGIDIF